MLIPNISPIVISRLGSLLRSLTNVGGLSSMALSTSGEKANAALKQHRLIWIDCEMTGLTDDDYLLEVACLITEGDHNMTLVAEGPDIILHQPDSILQSMDEWCTRTHGESGLTKAVRESTIDAAEAERQLLSFMRRYTEPGVCPMAGNSVHADKTFLTKYMPQLVQHCHYRIVDVSTVKELCRRWYPEKYNAAPKKKLAHRALGDIKESLEELRYYRKAIFAT